MIRTKELIKVLERHGFILSRTSKHLIYKKDNVTVAVPHQRECNIGLARRILQQALFDRQVIFEVIG